MPQVSWGILSNGLLIDRAHWRGELRRLRPAFVQVSIEGKPETHEKIRGAGTYRQAAAGISCW